MKIIDLLNKIANGEEVPKINYDKHILKYNKDEKRFIDENGLNSLYEIDFSELNDEVEILEEGKTIPEKSNIDFNTKLPVSGCSENEAFMMTCISHLGKTIDSLIDYLKSKGDE